MCDISRIRSIIELKAMFAKLNRVSVYYPWCCLSVPLCSLASWMHWLMQYKWSAIIRTKHHSKRYHLPSTCWAVISKRLWSVRLSGCCEHMYRKCYNTAQCHHNIIVIRRIMSPTYYLLSGKVGSATIGTYHYSRDTVH